MLKRDKLSQNPTKSLTISAGWPAKPARDNGHHGGAPVSRERSNRLTITGNARLKLARDAVCWLSQKRSTSCCKSKHLCSEAGV